MQHHPTHGELGLHTGRPRTASNCCLYSQAPWFETSNCVDQISNDEAFLSVWGKMSGSQIPLRIYRSHYFVTTTTPTTATATTTIEKI